MESHTGKGTCAGRWEGTGPWVACCGPSRPAHEKIKAFGTTTIIEVTFGARSPIIWEFGRRRAIPPRRRRGKRFKRSQDLASLGGSAREHPNRSHPSPTPRLEAQRPARLRALRADGPPPPPPSASGPPQFDLQRESLSGQPTPRSHTPHREPCTTVDKGDRSCAVPWGGGGGARLPTPPRNRSAHHALRSRSPGKLCSKEACPLATPLSTNKVTSAANRVASEAQERLRKQKGSEQNQRRPRKPELGYVKASRRTITERPRRPNSLSSESRL